jgi:3-deoxy-D-manno-octulosonic-acid transferase
MVRHAGERPRAGRTGVEDVTNRREAAIREARAAWSASTRARLSMYSALLWCLAPLVLLRLAWRARAEPPYGQAIGERFGGAGRDGPAAPGALWLHAVSLGETRAAEPLLAALRARQPGLRLLLTHGTATGRGAGARLLATGDAQRWQPFDLGHATRSFFHTHRPVLGVLMETEVWPNLLCAAADAGVPVVLANARLSERSLLRGQRVRTLLQPAFASLAATLAQTDDDAARLASAGAREPRVCGNLKFDAAPAPALLEQGRAWKAAAGERAIVLAALTRDGEEADLLAAWRACPAGTRPRLVIVPRHPQRFEAVAGLAAGAGWSVARRSAWPADGPDDAGRAADVWIGDSLLEMPAYYALADVALLGGSFGPFGGQNLIEGAASGCPIVIGPSTFNFAAAAEGASQP